MRVMRREVTMVMKMKGLRYRNSKKLRRKLAKYFKFKKNNL